MGQSRTAQAAPAAPEMTVPDHNIEVLIVSAKGDLFIVGWIDDLANPIRALLIRGRGWNVAIAGDTLFRMRRHDVEEARPGRPSHACGFTALGTGPVGAVQSGPCEIDLQLANGLSWTRSAASTMAEEESLRDITLGYLASASFFGNTQAEAMAQLDKGCGTHLIKLNARIVAGLVSAPYVERFQGPRSQFRGSIMVCLYGKPEFLTLQNALYAGLPGIEDYEFIYVCNSPELSETLLRDARAAHRLYGLDQTVVLLGGNAGFSAANNAAARIARSDRLIALNPDVFPRDADWARRHTALLDSRPDDETTLFGVPLYYDDGALMHAGMYLELDRVLSVRGRGFATRDLARVEHYGKGAPADSAALLRPRKVPAVTGAFISVQRDWFDSLGGFSENYIFGHYEDADMCLKSLASGKPAWLHDIKMWHLEGKGSTRRPHHEGGALVNRWQFSRAWAPVIARELNGPTPTSTVFAPGTAP